MTTAAATVAASELRDLHRRLDTLALLQPSSIPALRILVDEMEPPGWIAVPFQP